MKLVEKLRFTTYPDIFMQPIWQDLAAVDNPELSALAEFLPVVHGLKGQSTLHCEEVQWCFPALEEVGQS